MGGATAIILSVVAMIMPAIGGMAAGSKAVDDYCDCMVQHGVVCLESDKDAAKAAVSALGVLAAYILAYGWLAVVLAIVGISMGGATCCGCCKANEAKNPSQGVVVQGQSQPARLSKPSKRATPRSRPPVHRPARAA